MIQNVSVAAGALVSSVTTNICQTFEEPLKTLSDAPALTCNNKVRTVPLAIATGAANLKNTQCPTLLAAVVPSEGEAISAIFNVTDVPAIPDSDPVTVPVMEAPLEANLIANPRALKVELYVPLAIPPGAAGATGIGEAVGAGSLTAVQTFQVDALSQFPLCADFNNGIINIP
jgi:hypothetical protein